MPNIDFNRAISASRAASEDARAEAARVLAETDWIVIRTAETGVPLPQHIASLRKQARQTLSNSD
jgi:hypothetical protein